MHQHHVSGAAATIEEMTRLLKPDEVLCIAVLHILAYADARSPRLDELLPDAWANSLLAAPSAGDADAT